MPVTQANNIDIIDGLYQRSMFLILKYIFFDLLAHDITTIGRSAQVSTTWRSILHDSLKIFKKTFLRRVNHDPLSRMIHCRWKALKSEVPEVAVAEKSGDYGILCRHLMKERRQVTTNRRNHKIRTRKVDINPYLLLEDMTPSAFFLCKYDDQLTAFYTLRHDQLIILVWDRWTLVFKYQLVVKDEAIGTSTEPTKCFVEWNDNFMAACADSKMAVWDVKTGQIVFVLWNDSPILNPKPSLRFYFTDLLMNCGNILVASLSTGKLKSVVGRDDSKLFICRLSETGNSPPEHRVIHFPSVWFIDIVDMNCEFMVLQLSDSNDWKGIERCVRWDSVEWSEKQANLDLVQIRSVCSPFDLITEKRNANLFLYSQVIDRSWLLVENKSSVFQLWNLRTGRTYTLVKPPKGNKGRKALSCRIGDGPFFEIVGQYDEESDQCRQLELNELLPQDTIDTNNIRLTSDTTSCFWRRKYLSHYLGGYGFLTGSGFIISLFHEYLINSIIFDYFD